MPSQKVHVVWLRSPSPPLAHLSCLSNLSSTGAIPKRSRGIGRYSLTHLISNQARYRLKDLVTLFLSSFDNDS